MSQNFIRVFRVYDFNFRVHHGQRVYIAFKMYGCLEHAYLYSIVPIFENLQMYKDLTLNVKVQKLNSRGNATAQQVKSRL